VRLFVAIDPSTQAREHMAAALPPLTGLRPAPVDTWHITLVFCGEVEASTAASLETELAQVAAAASPVELRLRGSGAFGSVLWVGVDGDVGALAEACREAARCSGIEVEDAPYRAHLTIARAPRGARPVRQLAALATYTGPTWRVDRLRLVRSRLGSPLRHETLRAWPLGAG
jgi:2'-5' RNA ligase